MNKKIAIGMAIMAMAAASVQAVIYTSVGNGLWSSGTTWSTTGGATPGSTDTADLARVGGSQTVTLNSTVANPMGNVQIGRTTAGNLIINSGAFLGMLSASSLTIGESGGVGTLVMNGGTVTGRTISVSQTAVSSAGSSAAIHGGTITLDGTITVGKFANGSLTMDGGSVLANKLQVGDSGNTTVGTASLTGGTIELSATNATALTINTAPGSKLTMEGNGTLIIGGNQWSQINTFVGLGALVWDNGGSIAGVGDKTWDNGNGDYIHTAYDAGANKTTVWVNQTIPEPATVGMLGLGSLIVLLVRRMRG